MPAVAATCSQAGSQGTAPATWQTYCWIDFSTYSDATARTASGQNFTINLSDGSVLTFNVKTSGAATTAITAPSWTGAAVGNSAFLNIPGSPILYQTAGGLTNPSTIIFSNILITPPSGGTVSAYAFVAADAESTDNAESLSFTTNGSNWVMLDSVPAISGSSMPSQSGIGTTTFTEGGNGVTGNTGAYIVGSNSPTTITTVLTGQGLQGAMFAVRFASMRLTKQISGARVDAADQFKFDIKSTSTGSTLATGTTSGTGLGPFTAAAISLASGIPLTIAETMAPGSVNSLSHYDSKLTCTNSSSGSSTSLPTNVSTTSYNFGALQFGDAILCTYTNTPYPHLKLTKALGFGGRIADTDQFVMNVNQGASAVATTTTTGTASTISTGTTPNYQAIVGTAYNFNEAASGTTTLSQYRGTLLCTNAKSGSSTTLPTTLGSSLTPQMGDVISCTITNTAQPKLTLAKALGTGGRQLAADQFIMNINQGSTTVATTTTTGTGSTVSTGSTPQYLGTSGTAYTLAELGSGATSLAQYTSALACTNSNTSSATTLPTAVGGSVTPVYGDIITCTITNTKVTASANLTIVKSSTIISDPINSTTNPKAIPGAIIRYSLLLANAGTDRVDSGTIFILDSLPSQIAVGTSASWNFTDGTPASNVTFNATNDVRYSNQTTAPTTFAVCSASPHNYTPTSAYDANVKHVCINPKGRMNASTGTPPNFTITFQAQIK